VFYKYTIEKPATIVLSLGSKIISIPDHLPIIGGCCRKTRSGTANIVRKQFGKLLDRQQVNNDEADELLKKKE
jgi:hypothetical protein